MYMVVKLGAVVIGELSIPRVRTKAGESAFVTREPTT